MITNLENEYLIVRFDTLGAEMVEIVDRKSDVQYLWDADPAYWKRHAPVLFPIVGSLKDGSYTYNGQTYKMSQHGFARDTEFKIAEKTSDTIVFAMNSSAKTKENYPFDFELQCSYKLEGRSVQVGWHIINKTDGTMYFSIGGHPAFCRSMPEQNQAPYILKFDKEGELTYYQINDAGLRLPEAHTLQVTKEGVELSSHFFDNGVYIFENQGISSITMQHPNGHQGVEVSFNTPVVGIWSPDSNAPFVCIEPWYGRCDSSVFAGTLEEREFGNALAKDEEFSGGFTVTFHA